MNKDVFRWALYDFANSILFIAFIFYFPQWLVVDQGNPAWWFNATLIAPSILFIFTAPPLAASIDRKGEKIQGLRLWTCITILTFLLLSGVTVFAPAFDAVAAVLFAFGMYAYLNCFLYYSPILNDLSTAANRAHISGIASSFNFAGQVAGLLLTLPLVSGAVSIFGSSARAEAFFPSVVVMAILVIPMLMWHTDRPCAPAPEGIGVLGLLKSTLANKSLALLLLAFFFFGDALLTFSSNFTLYLEEVFAAPDLLKALLGIGILALAAIGSATSGAVADRVGHKKILVTLLVLWVVLFTVAPFIRDLGLIAPLFLFGGLLFGPVWAISRAMVGQLLAPGATASSYSYFVIAERFSTFLGPALWGGVLLVAGESIVGYQFALFSMGILTLIGLLLLFAVPETKGKGS